MVDGCTILQQDAMDYSFFESALVMFPCKCRHQQYWHSCFAVTLSNSNHKVMFFSDFDENVSVHITKLEDLEAKIHNLHQDQQNADDQHPPGTQNEFPLRACDRLRLLCQNASKVPVGDADSSDSEDLEPPLDDTSLRDPDSPLDLHSPGPKASVESPRSPPRTTTACNHVACNDREVCESGLCILHQVWQRAHPQFISRYGMRGRMLNTWNTTKTRDRTRLQKTHAIDMLRFLVPTPSCRLRTIDEAKDVVLELIAVQPAAQNPKQTHSPTQQVASAAQRIGRKTSRGAIDHDDCIRKQDFIDWFETSYLKSENSAQTCPWRCSPQSGHESEGPKDACEWMLVLTARLLQLSENWHSYIESPGLAHEHLSDDITFDDTVMTYAAAKSVCENMWITQWRWKRAQEFIQIYSEVTEKLWNLEQAGKPKRQPEAEPSASSSSPKTQPVSTKTMFIGREDPHGQRSKLPSQAYLEHTLFAEWDKRANAGQENRGLYLSDLKLPLEELLGSSSERNLYHEVSLLMHMIDPHGGTGHDAYVHIKDLAAFFVQSPLQVRKRAEATVAYDLAHDNADAVAKSQSGRGATQFHKTWRCVSEAEMHSELADSESTSADDEVVRELHVGELVEAMEIQEKHGRTRVRAKVAKYGERKAAEGWIWTETVEPKHDHSKTRRKRSSDQSNIERSHVVLVPVKTHSTYLWDWEAFDEHFADFWGLLRKLHMLQHAPGMLASDETACSITYENFARFFLPGGQYSPTATQIPFLQPPDVRFDHSMDEEQVNIAREFGRLVSCTAANRMVRAASRVRWRESIGTAVLLWNQIDVNRRGWISNDESKHLIGEVSSQHGHLFKMLKKLFKQALSDLRESSIQKSLLDDLDSMIIRLKTLGVCYEEDQRELELLDDWNELLSSIDGLAEALGPPEAGDIWNKQCTLEVKRLRAGSDPKLTSAAKTALGSMERELGHLKNERRALLAEIRDACGLLRLIRQRHEPSHLDRIVAEEKDEHWDLQQKLQAHHDRARKEDMVPRVAFLAWWRTRYWAVKEHTYKLTKLNIIWRTVDTTGEGFKVWKARAILSVLWDINEDTYQSRNAFNRRFVSWWHDHDVERKGFVTFDQFASWWVMQPYAVLNRAFVDPNTGHQRDWHSVDMHYNHQLMVEFGAMLAEVEGEIDEEKDRRERDLDNAMRELDADINMSARHAIEQERQHATWGRIKQHVLRLDQAPFGVLSGGTRPPMLKTRLRLFGTVRTDELNALRDDWTSKSGCGKAVHSCMCRVNVMREKNLLARSREAGNADQSKSGQSIGEILGDFQVHKHRFCIDTHWIRDTKLWIEKHFVEAAKNVLHNNLEPLVSPSQHELMLLSFLWRLWVSMANNSILVAGAPVWTRGG